MKDFIIGVFVGITISLIAAVVLFTGASKGQIHQSHQLKKEITIEIVKDADHHIKPFKKSEK